MSGPGWSRLHLRRLAASDAERVLGWRNSPEVARFMFGDHEIGAEEHARWLARAVDRPDRRDWVAQVDGRPAGMAYVAGLGDPSGRAEWGSYLADPADRGRGLGAAVEFLVLDWAFGRAGVRKLWCEVLGSNAGAWRLHLAFGFTREAELRAHVVKAGREEDAVGLGLLASEWPQARARAVARLAERGHDLAALTIEG